MKLTFENRFQAAHELLDEHNSDGYTRGHAEQVVGHLFIAEGHRKFRRGILNALVGLIVAVVYLSSIIYTVQHDSSKVPANGVAVQGTVSSVIGSGPRTSCNFFADYSVNGVNYQTSGSNGAWWRCDQTPGQSVVVVTYDALQPATGTINPPRDWRSSRTAYLLGAANLLFVMVSLILCGPDLIVGRLLARHGQKLIRRNPEVPVDRTMAEVKARFVHVLHPLWKDGRGSFPPVERRSCATAAARECPSRRHAGARLVQRAHRRRWTGIGAVGWNPMDRREVAPLGQIDLTMPPPVGTRSQPAPMRCNGGSLEGRGELPDPQRQPAR